jgi:hypothetical protein
VDQAIPLDVREAPGEPAIESFTDDQLLEALLSIGYDTQLCRSLADHSIEVSVRQFQLFTRVCNCHRILRLIDELGAGTLVIHRRFSNRTLVRRGATGTCGLAGSTHEIVAIDGQLPIVAHLYLYSITVGGAFLTLAIRFTSSLSLLIVERLDLASLSDRTVPLSLAEEISTVTVSLFLGGGECGLEIFDGLRCLPFLAFFLLALALITFLALAFSLSFTFFEIFEVIELLLFL